jgi:hypothetical protein
MTFPLSFARWNFLKWVVNYFYKSIYSLREHLQRASTKIKCNIRLKWKLECKWIQGKNNPITKKWKIKSNQKLEKKTKLKNARNIIKKKKKTFEYKKLIN